MLILRTRVGNGCRCVVFFYSLMFLVGCSNISAQRVFSHYSAANEAFYTELRHGDVEVASANLQDQGGDFLFNVEKGRLLQLQSRYEASKTAFESSDSAWQAQQQKATISLSDSGESLASFALNDNVNSYQPADYELGFLHLYQALNYIQLNKLSDALVEFRRANMVQEQAKAVRESTINEERDSLKQEGVNTDIGDVLAKYPSSSRTLKTTQNAYLYFLSALIFEAEGDNNDAYVDIRRALAIVPDNPIVIKHAFRLAKKLSVGDDLSLLKKQYPSYASDTVKNDGANVIFIVESGVVEALQPWQQSLYVYDYHGQSDLYSLALPYYRMQSDITKTQVELNEHILPLNELADVNLMAQQQLSERIPGIALRQLIRLVVKKQIRDETAQDNPLANLMLNVWNSLTEQPDTRSWISLPSRVSVGEKRVQAGKQQITVAGTRYDFTVNNGETVLVWVSNQGQHLSLWHKNLGAL